MRRLFYASKTYIIIESYLNWSWIGHVLWIQCVPNLFRISKSKFKKIEVWIFEVLLYIRFSDEHVWRRKGKPWSNYGACKDLTHLLSDFNKIGLQRFQSKTLMLYSHMKVLDQDHQVKYLMLSELSKSFSEESCIVSLDNIGTMFGISYWKNLSQCMRFPTMWYVRPAKPQISLRIGAVWSEPLLVAWIFYEC